MARGTHGTTSTLAGIVAAFAATLTAACSIGPKYTRPSTPVAAAYKELGSSNVEGTWKPAHPHEDAARNKWWERFNDPRLNALQEKLDISNQNVAAAAANLQAA